MEKIDERNQNRTILRNSFFSVGFKILFYIISFLTTPLLVRCLGEEKYGIYVTALSFISWIYYFDFGIGSGLRNKITESEVRNQKTAAHQYVNVAYRIVSVISLIAFGIIFFASFILNFDSLLNANLRDENLNTILTVAVLIACINFILSLSKNVLFGIHKIAFVDGLGIISRLIMLIALWIYSTTGQSFMMFIVLVEGLSEMVKNIIASVYLKRKHPHLAPVIREKVDYSYSKGILSFGLQVFVMQVSALVLNSTDNIIIMKLYNAAEVTPYNMGHMYFSVINAFFTAATGSLWTAYTTAYTMKDAGYIRKTLKRALGFYALTFAGIVLAYFLFRPFMRLYLGYDLSYQPGLILLIGVYYAILIFSHNFSAFVHGIGKVKYATIACAVGAIANIPCSIFFATTCGMRINGVILGSIVSLLITTPCYVCTAMSEIRKMERNAEA